MGQMAMGEPRVLRTRCAGVSVLVQRRGRRLATARGAPSVAAAARRARPGSLHRRPPRLACAGCSLPARASPRSGAPRVRPRGAPARRESPGRARPVRPRAPRAGRRVSLPRLRPSNRAGRGSRSEAGYSSRLHARQTVVSSAPEPSRSGWQRSGPGNATRHREAERPPEAREGPVGVSDKRARRAAPPSPGARLSPAHAALRARGARRGRWHPPRQSATGIGRVH